jgi:hypothetical protein
LVVVLWQNSDAMRRENEFARLPHPEVPALRAGLEGCSFSAAALALRGSALCAEHLRVRDK